MFAINYQTSQNIVWKTFIVHVHILPNIMTLHNADILSLYIWGDEMFTDDLVAISVPFPH